MDLMNPSFWINTLSFIVINIALVALVVLAVAGFFASRQPSGRLARFSRSGRSPAARAGARDLQPTGR